MALVKFGNGLWLPPKPRCTTAFTDSSTTALTATGHKVAFVGRMWNRDGADKTLVGVGLCFGAITKAGGSGLTISQQGIDHANGPPFQPDGVQAQSWAVANGNASLATNTWLNTPDNAGVAVTYGQEMAIVSEYDGSGRLGSDSITARGLTSADAGTYAAAGTAYYNGTTWAAQSVVPNLVLKFSDGTYGTLDGAWPHSAVGLLTYNVNNATQDEAGLEFTVPAPCKIDLMWSAPQVVTGSDYDTVLYSGTTPLATVSTDGNAIVGSGSSRFDPKPIAPSSLATGTAYRLTVKPTTATMMGLNYLDLNLAAHRQALPGFGEAGAFTSRVDGGAFAAVTPTRVPLMGLRISHVDDGAGGGGTSGGRRPRLRRLGA